MDRMLYLAMSGAKQSMIAQGINTNNLANASTTGFKQDLEQFRSQPVFGPGQPSRVYAMTERPATDTLPGVITTTGHDLDIAVKGDGWIAVQAADGTEAYTRAGDLHVDVSGVLVNGAGHRIIGNAGGPIAVPPAEKIDIAADGTITIRPVGQAPSVLAQIDRIKLVNPDQAELTKGEDGLMRLKSGIDAEADFRVQVVSGSLEGSNVNAVEAMVSMIELARGYDMQVKMMRSAKENDEAVTQLMKMA